MRSRLRACSRLAGRRIGVVTGVSMKGTAERRKQLSKARASFQMIVVGELPRTTTTTAGLLVAPTFAEKAIVRIDLALIPAADASTTTASSLYDLTFRRVALRAAHAGLSVVRLHDARPRR